MMGALAAALAPAGRGARRSSLGAAAGAANFLRHGLGTGTRAVVEELVRSGSSCAALARRRGGAASRRATIARGAVLAIQRDARLGTLDRAEPRERAGQAHGAAGVRGVGVAAEDVDEAAAPPARACAGAGPSRQCAAVAWTSAPAADERASRSARSAPRWRSGWAIRLRKPALARAGRRSRSASPTAARAAARAGSSARRRRARPPAARRRRGASTIVSATSPAAGSTRVADPGAARARR